MSARAVRRKADWQSAAILALAAISFANAAMYISYASIPFVTSDGWYFVDSFLNKYYNGGVTLQDLYMKRSADDHAQPLQKLLLIWNADHFDLDFVVESYIGLGIAALAWLLMFMAARHDNRMAGLGYWWVLPMAASAASFVSLSGGMVFNWSLVTLGYLGPLAVVLMALSAWHAVDRNRWWPFLLTVPLVVFSLDTSALICAIATGGALLLRELRMRGAGWRRTVAALAVLAITVSAYRYISRAYLYPNAAAGAEIASISALLELGWAKLSNMVLAIAALTIADKQGALTRLFANPDVPHQLLGIMVIAAHAWFWWRAARDRWNQTQFLAVCLMLFCYGAIAGIVLGRVPIFGPDYVFQQRYLMMYQLGTVAIALMAAGSRWRDWTAMQRRTVGAAALSLMVLQLPLSSTTWEEAPYVQAYGNNLGRQILLLGIDPSMRLASCAPTLVVCTASREEQVRSIELLRKHRLNAFSEPMLERYSLQPLKRYPGPAEVVPAP
ncbi:hypothetical protein [Pseudoxanthomonas sp.]|jgi:hypothetical protein|uniref:hypothetical protein n=1 Tax=Pseudoxanthomonas sp. TaxID=1871049 RepID=UPI002E131E82|nr:hypothetical protein [Pseudoxanthomonas sp.]